LLGLEWVLPTGEIMRTGSSGSGAGWFSGDGPGPSLRGVLRGYGGYQGGIGIFTKCAGHLHPWYGPSNMEIKGKSPYYEAEIPYNHAYHVLEWPSWQKCGDAISKIGEARIGFAMHKTGGPGTHGSVVAGNNNEYYEKWQAGGLRLPRVSYALVMTGSTPEEYAYQVKTLDKILAETGGKVAAVGEDPTWQRRDYINMIAATFIPRLAFRCTGSFAVDGLVGIETVDHAAWALELDEPHRDRYAQMGIIMDDGSTNSWGAPYEGSHMALYEAGHPYNPMDENSAKGMQQMEKDGVELSLKNFLAGAGLRKPEVVNSIGPDFPKWSKKFRKLLDPNSICDTKTGWF
jgi:glycolate oxidase